ncbi:MAG: hypothetical protein Tsb0013_17890 [Phycisphaerales bacterium]
MAVMSLLVTLLLPSLGRAREASHRTASASNIRQQGIGTQLFAYDRQGHLPTSLFQSRENRGIDAPEQMVFLRVNRDAAEGATGRATPKTPGEATSANPYVWDGLGKLIEREYITHGQVFYNPSHDDIHTYERYQAAFTGADGEIVSNYQYRWDRKTPVIDRLRPQTTLIADAMRSQPEYNHRVGNNMLKGDLSISWFQDVDGSLYNSLAERAPQVQEAGFSPMSEASREGVINGWKLLDDATERGVTLNASETNDPLGALLNPDFK